MSDGWRGDAGRDARHAEPDDVRDPRWAEAVAARGALVPADDEVPNDFGAAPEHAAGNLGRYARWQWRDFWRNRGGWLALGALLGVTMLASVLHVMAGNTVAAAQIAGVAHLCFTLGGAAAALIGVGGLVSRDRERGLQRFLFAKPVRPDRYYLQALAVNSAGALAVLAGAVLLAAAIVGSAFPIATVLTFGVAAYVLTAGTTFLVSTLVRFDAAVAALWLMLGFGVTLASKAGLAIARPLSWLFPQGQAVAVFDAIARTSPAASPQAISLGVALIVLVGVLYGLLAAAGGVAVLRRRAISR